VFCGFAAVFPDGLTLFEVLRRIDDETESGEGGGATSLYLIGEAGASRRKICVLPVKVMLAGLLAGWGGVTLPGMIAVF